MHAYYHHCKSIHTKKSWVIFNVFSVPYNYGWLHVKCHRLVYKHNIFSNLRNLRRVIRMLFNRDSNVMTKRDDEPNCATSQYHSERGADKVRNTYASIAAKVSWSIGWAAADIKINPQVTSQPWYCCKDRTGLLPIKPRGLTICCGLSVHSPRLIFACPFLLYLIFFTSFFPPTSPLWGITTQLS